MFRGRLSLDDGREVVKSVLFGYEPTSPSAFHPVLLLFRTVLLLGLYLNQRSLRVDRGGRRTFKNLPDGDHAWSGVAA